MTPDATRHNPDPAYLRGLLTRAGLSQNAAARRIGISTRMMRYYLATGETGRTAPYLMQFALEALARVRSSERNVQYCATRE